VEFPKAVFAFAPKMFSTPPRTRTTPSSPPRLPLRVSARRFQGVPRVERFAQRLFEVPISPIAVDADNIWGRDQSFDLDRSFASASTLPILANATLSAQDNSAQDNECDLSVQAYSASTPFAYYADIFKNYDAIVSHMSYGDLLHFFGDLAQEMQEFEDEYPELSALRVAMEGMTADRLRARSGPRTNTNSAFDTVFAYFAAN